MKNKDVIKKILKDSKKQLESYYTITNEKNFKPYPRDITFKNKLNKKFYEKTKEMTVISFKLYKQSHFAVKEAKKKGTKVTDHITLEFSKFYEVIKNKLLPKFNDDLLTFASFVAFQRLLIVSFSKKALSRTYEIILKQSEIMKESLLKIKNKVIETKKEIKSLHETTDILLEGKLKDLVEKPLRMLGITLYKSFRIILEGWAFVLKKTAVVVKEVQGVINKVNGAIDKNVGRLVTNLLSNINPDLIEGFKMFGGDTDQIESYVGSWVRRGISFLITCTAFTATGALFFHTATSLMSKVSTAESIVSGADSILKIYDEYQDPEFFDEIANL